MPPVRTLRLAQAVVLVETLLVWVYVGYLVVEVGDEAGGWRVVGYFGLYALVFAGLSWALARRRRWVRAPLIVLQILLFASGLGLARDGAPPVGVVVMALAVACIGLLLAPSTRLALAGTDRG